MTLTATYTMLPDYTSRNDLVLPRPYISMQKTGGNMMQAGNDLDRSGQSTYKYYVLSDSDDMVYNRMKNTEKLLYSIRGSLVDLYA